MNATLKSPYTLQLQHARIARWGCSFFARTSKTHARDVGPPPCPASHRWTPRNSAPLHYLAGTQGEGVRSMESFPVSGLVVALCHRCHSWLWRPCVHFRKASGTRPPSFAGVIGIGCGPRIELEGTLCTGGTNRCRQDFQALRLVAIRLVAVLLGSGHQPRGRSQNRKALGDRGGQTQPIRCRLR